MTKTIRQVMVHLVAN